MSCCITPQPVPQLLLPHCYFHSRDYFLMLYQKPFQNVKQKQHTKVIWNYCVLFSYFGRKVLWKGLTGFFWPLLRALCGCNVTMIKPQMIQQGFFLLLQGGFFFFFASTDVTILLKKLVWQGYRNFSPNCAKVKLHCISESPQTRAKGLMSPGSATEMQTQHAIPVQPTNHWNSLRPANRQ